MAGRIRQGSCPHRTYNQVGQTSTNQIVCLCLSYTHTKQKPVAGTLGQMLWKRDQLDWKNL